MHFDQKRPEEERSAMHVVRDSLQFDKGTGSGQLFLRSSFQMSWTISLPLLCKAEPFFHQGL
eukprot:44240-Amphidinium_carterae.1